MRLTMAAEKEKRDKENYNGDFAGITKCRHLMWNELKVSFLDQSSQNFSLKFLGGTRWIFSLTKMINE